MRRSKPVNHVCLAALLSVQIISCLAGGRNKMAADKAYEFLNNELANTGLEIRTPETIRDVSKSEVPIWVRGQRKQKHWEQPPCLPRKQQHISTWPAFSILRLAGCCSSH